MVAFEGMGVGASCVVGKRRLLWCVLCGVGLVLCVVCGGLLLVKGGGWSPWVDGCYEMVCCTKDTVALVC